jgi:hypothetical protein
MTRPADIPSIIGADAKAVADWFIANHAGAICGDQNTLASDLADVLADFRSVPTNAGLTSRQRQCLGFIKRYLSGGDGTPPTVREIADGIGVTLSRAHSTLKQLQHRGYITMTPRCPRSIALVGKVDDVSAAHKNSGEA